MGKALSRSGRYLEYRDESVPPSRKVRDLMTGEEWDIPGLAPYDGGPFLNDAFVDNDQNLLYTVMRGEGFALFKIPIRGGDAVQIASVNLPGEAVTHLDASPDGGTIVFSRYAVGSSGSMENRLYIGDLDTGRITEVLENCTSVRSHSARFTPDGKRIVYVIGNWEKPGDEFKLYIKDVSGLAGTRDEQVSVADDAPKGFALTGNHPNPFNPSTSVSFTIPSAGTVRLTVYDVTGRTVRTMVSSVLSAGAHEMVWDGRDDSGKSVSSGTYLARLKMGGFTASHRMTLVK
jgi:WD40 repeat protein